jgi:penicillin-binding protein 1A
MLALVGGRLRKFRWNRVAVHASRVHIQAVRLRAAVRAGLTEMVDDSPSIHRSANRRHGSQDYDDTTLGMITMRRSPQRRNLSTIAPGMSLGKQTVIGEARRWHHHADFINRPYTRLAMYPLEIIAAYSARDAGHTRTPQFICASRTAREYSLAIDAAQEMMDADTRGDARYARDVVRRGTAFSAVWRGGFTLPSGGKTGTTDDYTDAWYIGFTPEIVAGIWGATTSCSASWTTWAAVKRGPRGWRLAWRGDCGRLKDWERPTRRHARGRSQPFATPFCPLSVVVGSPYRHEPPRVPVHPVFGPARR